MKPSDTQLIAVVEGTALAAIWHLHTNEGAVNAGAAAQQCGTETVGWQHAILHAGTDCGTPKDMSAIHSKAATMKARAMRDPTPFQTNGVGKLFRQQKYWGRINRRPQGFC